MIETLDKKNLLSNETGFYAKMKKCYKEYGYLLVAFIIPFVIMYMVYLAMEIHPFGNGSVLVLDLNGQYVDFYEALRHFIYGDASFLYTFSRALGGEFMGIYSYYLASPLSYIVALFPQEDILDALLLIFLLKVGFCSSTFAFYLHKTSSFRKNFSKINVISFSILYALSAYCVTYQHNSMWIDAVIWLPLVTYGIEELIKKGHYKIFTVSLAMSLLSNFYIGYMTCIYTAIYFFIYYFMHNENDRNNPFQEKAHFAKSFIRIGFFSLLAIAISAVILLTTYYSLSFGKTTFSSTQWGFEVRFGLLDMFVKFLPCSYDSVRTSALPFVYCGVLTLLLIPVYFCSRRFSTREKILSGVLIAIFILSFVINPLDIIWHGFQKPNWLNYRYSFMLSFVLLTLAYKGICEIKKASTKTLIFSSGIILALVAVAQKTEFANYVLGDGSNDRNHVVGKLLDLECIWFSAALVIVYLIILGVMKCTQRPQYIALVLAVFVSVEVFCNGLSNSLDLGSDVIYTSYSTYTEYIGKLRSVTNAIKEKDSSFYRMDELSHRKVNDNMAVNAHGLTNSTSTLNATTIKFLQNMGYFAKAHEAQYKGGNIVADSLLGVKYTLQKDKDVGGEMSILAGMLIDETFYSEFLVDDTYTAYENKYALSLAYAVNSAIENIDFGEYINPYDRMNAVITAMLGEDETVEVFKALEIIETTTSNITEKPARDPFEGANYKFPYVQYDVDANGGTPMLQLAAKLPETDNELKSHYVYFYMPSEFQRAFKLYANNTNYGSMFGNNTMRAVPLGIYNEGQLVSVSITPEASVLYVSQGVGILYYLDEEVFADAIGKLAKSQLVIDENYKDDHLTGTITTKEDGLTVFTSIPFDEGWQVYVDGERVDIRGILGDSSHENETEGATVAFTIENAGEHQIELRYMPRSFTLGLSITVVGLIVFALLIIFEKKINRFATKILCPIVIPTNGIEPAALYSDDDEDVHGDGTTDISLESAEPTDHEQLEKTTEIDAIDNKPEDKNGGN